MLHCTGSTVGEFSSDIIDLVYSDACLDRVDNAIRLMQIRSAWSQITDHLDALQIFYCLILYFTSGYVLVSGFLDRKSVV